MAEPGPQDCGGYLLLTRPECHLCEDFFEALKATFPEVAARVIEADVDSRSDWQTRFGRRVPVLVDAMGAVLAEGVFDPERFAGQLD